MQNKIFSLVMITTIVNFDVSRVLINGGSSCNIMYSNLFDKMGLEKEKLWPYEGSILQDFNNTTTRLLGYVKLMVTLGEGQDTITIYSQFMLVPCKSVYNYILGRSFTTTLDALASLVHLKPKYHNINDELTMISANLYGEKKIYKALQQD